MSFSIRYCSALSKTVKWCSELFDVALFFKEIAAKLSVLIIVIIDSFSLCTRLAPGRMRVVDNECCLRFCCSRLDVFVVHSLCPQDILLEASGSLSDILPEPSAYRFSF